jgi:pimeloyl-ACP methyl ester carboxylesterase
MNAVISSEATKAPAPPVGKKRIWRVTASILLGLAALIIILAATGATYEAVMAAGDDERYPARGQLVDVGGHRLHINCVGKGSPTVLLAAGHGGFSLDWSLVQPQLAATTRVCAYDRAGYGWSEPNPQSATPRQIAEDLHTLLANARIAGPYVLVGHSAAGKHVRLYAQLYPQDVAGIVLVDARHESVDANLAPNELAAERKRERRFQRTLWVTARIGLVRPFWAAAWPKIWPTTENLTSETRTEIGVLQARSQQVKTVLREGASRSDDNAQLAAASSVGSIPVIVLAAGQLVAQNPAWLPAQEQMARLSSNSKLVIVDDSGHYIHWDTPTVVVDAISQVVQATRLDQQLEP